MTSYTKQPKYKNKDGEKRWAVIVRRTNNNVQRVWSKKTGKDEAGNNTWKFKAAKAKPGDGWKWRTNKERAEAAAERHAPVAVVAHAAVGRGIEVLGQDLEAAQQGVDVAHDWHWWLEQIVYYINHIVDGTLPWRRT